MDYPQMDYGINAIEEEPEEFDSTFNKGALACMINSEVGAVLAIMRRNVQWGGRFMAVNPVLYLQPFLDVVRSDETGAPITGVILSLVYKILTLNVIDLNTMNVKETMHLVVDVVTSCRFEVTDPASEVVLVKILQVLLACMKSKAAIVLNIVEGEVPLANGVASSSKPECVDDGKTVNLYNEIKVNIITNGLKYSFATENWGKANVAGTRVGVSQVLNRLTYASTLSHLRRLNSLIGREGLRIGEEPRINGLHNCRIGNESNIGILRVEY
ncbi:hypothetical protein GIB67_016211 [Kingdonia uniflora]|uniref:DNA-directed RNA polymerase n=1 Tax=Kingdonia uniflora TaxID=39325 RepID=A0A7J7LTA0_9MAGN|nr:hypothetical protein GIB67_016211 [Kingdonia uniflora]